LEAGLLLETLGAAVSPQALLTGILGLVLGIIVGAQFAFLMVAVIALITITAFAVGARL
jgi:uncharacterized protein involved in exopolysaccharide biosynthesis